MNIVSIGFDGILNEKKKKKKEEIDYSNFPTNLLRWKTFLFFDKGNPMLLEIIETNEENITFKIKPTPIKIILINIMNLFNNIELKTLDFNTFLKEYVYNRKVENLRAFMKKTTIN